MIRLPRFDSFFKEDRQNQFARDLLQSLGYIPDVSIYVLDSVVWKTPTTLKVPLYNGSLARAKSPDVVECARATDLSAKTTPVHFGATSWEWVGDGSVSIFDVDGLVVGTTYRLVFEVVG